MILERWIVLASIALAWLAGWGIAELGNPSIALSPAGPRALRWDDADHYEAVGMDESWRAGMRRARFEATQEPPSPRSKRRERPRPGKPRPSKSRGPAIATQESDRAVAPNTSAQGATGSGGSIDSGGSTGSGGSTDSGGSTGGSGGSNGGVDGDGGGGSNDDTSGGVGGGGGGG